MNGVPSRGPRVTPYDPFYPSTEDDPVAETDPHVLAMVTLIATLRAHFADRDDWYIIGDLFLYYEEGNRQARVAPDLMVIKGVPTTPGRPNFRIWEEGGAIPCVVFEIASENTVDEDRGRKFEIYERLGVHEYFLFDPMGGLLERPLMGYVNSPGVGFEEMKPGGIGPLLSQELGLLISAERGTLRFTEFRTNQPVPTADERARQWTQVVSDLDQAHHYAAEVKAERDEALAHRDEALAERDAARLRADQEAEGRRQAEQQAEAERQRAMQEAAERHQAEQRAEAQRQRAEAERQRAEALAAELDRLRKGLPPPEVSPSA